MASIRRLLERPIDRPTPTEQTLLSTRPHPVTIVLRSALAVILAITYATVLMPMVAIRSSPRLAFWLLIASIGVAGLRIVLEVVRWLHRRYTLTDARLTSSDGLFRRWDVEMPLESVQYVAMHKTLVERVLGLGTVGVSSAGGGLEIVWLWIDAPARARDTIIAARDAARAEVLHRTHAGRVAATGAPGATAARESSGHGPAGVIAGERSGAPPRRPRVIGLAGGVGSGKSAVARAMQSLGAAISDSDQQAKAMLNDEDVRQTLVGWWGAGVVGADGRIDRKAVADIVFADPDERRRLEALIHPRLRAGREQLRLDAAAESMLVVVIDAPLLFEAGVDAECDEVWFVDSPLDQRVERVRESRGWDRAELERREAAQMPVDEKERRSTRVIANDGDLDGLRERVGEALDAALAGRRPG